MAKQRLQAGFTLVEALLIILILVVVGFAGYYIWDRQNSKEETKKTTDTSSVNKPKTNNSNVNNWFAFTPQNDEYTILLPDGWKFDYSQQESSSILYSPTNRMIDSTDVRAVVTSSIGGYGMGTGFWLHTEPKESATVTNIGMDGEKLSSLKTGEGKEVLVTFRENTEEGNMSYEVGAKIYSYFIDYGDRVVAAQYSFNPGDKDQRSTVEKSIKTIVLP